jgi:hypothetical protein
VVHRIVKLGGGGFCARCGEESREWLLCHECIDELLYRERDTQQLRRAEISRIAREGKYLR